MKLLKTIAVSFSMFSSLPMPQFEWDKDSMRYSLCAFPLIGIVIGLADAAWVYMAAYFHLPDLLKGTILCLIPVLLTGGIHLDGYADTSDALASYADPERRLEILKDPHIGAFAAIRLCCYFLLYAALWICLPEYRYLPVLLSFTLSRFLSGFAVTTFPLAKNTGLAHTFAAAADKKHASWFLVILAILLSILLSTCGWCGLAMAFTAWLVFFHFRHMCSRKFGGLTGDLSGWFLIQAEKWMLIALAAVEFLELFIR